MVKRTSSGSWLQVAAGVARDGDYRAIAIVSLLLGVQDGVLIPYLALWVTHGLHGSSWQASFIYVPFGLVVVATGLLMSVYSDRVSRRRSLIVASLLVDGIARAGMAFSSSYGVAVVLYAVTGFGPLGMIYALLRDLISEKEGHDEVGAFVTTLVRTVYSVGWLVGPPLGALIVGILGFRGLLFASAVLLFAAMGWAVFAVSEPARVQPTILRRPPRLGARGRGLLVLLFLLGILLLSGNEGRANFLSLYATRKLHFSVSAVGWIFSIAVISELLLIPLAGRLADRFGVVTLYLFGVGTQAVYFFLASAATAYWLFLVLQIAYAFVVATVSGVGIVFAQRLLGRERTALATSTYLVTGGLGALVNSGLMGIAFISTDLSHLFLVYGLFACAALGIALSLAQLSRRGQVG